MTAYLLPIPVGDNLRLSSFIGQRPILLLLQFDTYL
jgi:hypothetical protein